jgi:hypothetical protein
MSGKILHGLGILIGVLIILLIYSQIFLRVDSFTNITAPAYTDKIIYKEDDIVVKDGYIFKMTEGIGAPGYPPPIDGNKFWRKLTPEEATKIIADKAAAAAAAAAAVASDSKRLYSNTKIYELVNDVVIMPNGVYYKLRESPGRPDVSPIDYPVIWAKITAQEAEELRDANPTTVNGGFDQTRVYEVGEIVKRYGFFYKMTEKVGSPGFVPPLEGNQFWKIISAAEAAAAAAAAKAAAAAVAEEKARVAAEAAAVAKAKADAEALAVKSTISCATGAKPKISIKSSTLTASCPKKAIPLVSIVSEAPENIEELTIADCSNNSKPTITFKGAVLNAACPKKILATSSMVRNTRFKAAS